MLSVSIPICLPTMLSFNPHPPLRADAICIKRPRYFVHQLFQSSPALTGGCYSPAGVSRGRTKRVSILTRPYGRMLCSLPRASLIERMVFQSSPALTGGCYPATQTLFRILDAFQSSPALTGGCYGSLTVAPKPPVPRFQSSPALTGGCYRGIVTGQQRRPPFQSSPALTGGCYRRATKRLRHMPCFNPHPPLRADAIRGVQDPDGEFGRVSILTRPYGRML